MVSAIIRSIQDAMDCGVLELAPTGSGKMTVKFLGILQAGY